VLFLNAINRGVRGSQNITLLPLEVSALTGNAGTNPRSPDKTGVNRC